MVFQIEDGQCRLIARNGNEFKSFSVLNDVIAAEIKTQSAVLDGEIVCLDDGGKPQFRDLLFRRGEPRFIAFDLLWYEGEDLRYLPLIERKLRLFSLRWLRCAEIAPVLSPEIQILTPRHIQIGND